MKNGVEHFSHILTEAVTKLQGPPLLLHGSVADVEVNAACMTSTHDRERTDVFFCLGTQLWKQFSKKRIVVDFPKHT